MAPFRSYPIRPDLLLRLPRELRDPIYEWALEAASSFPLKDAHVDGIHPVFTKNRTLYYEALEAFYKVNTFVLDLSSEPFLLTDSKSSYPEAKMHIRRLVVTGDECVPPGCSHDEYEQQYRSTYYRRRWAQLLDVPNLQTLEINLQKAHEDNLQIFDFGPILYHLRALRPDLELKFNISFDYTLETMWNDPMWNQAIQDRGPFDAYGSLYANSPFLGADRFGDAPLEPWEDRYQPMGFVDVSDLVEVPSDHDKGYVHRYLPTEEMPPARSLKQGLLSETPANRRMLARHYAVREPSLLRLQMQKHYEVYKKYEKGGGERPIERGDGDEGGFEATP